ncbi:LysR family transcriptional regulator [Rhizobium sp.]|jgi:DNA-binding transcriptional LysR family regulator|uniref:LysR family transcriptional regulator n=1 Tax=Rhizobium sp. TaxID=391 RepID=UPI002AA87CFA
MYRELQQFIVLVEQASVTKAATVLGITQSALSKSLQRLEDHLGLQLAERGPRGLVLTEEGRGIYDHARRVDAETRSLELDARTLGEGRIAARIDALIPLPAHLAAFLPKFGLQFIDGVTPIAQFNAGLRYRTSFAATRTGRKVCDAAKALMRAQ